MSNARYALAAVVLAAVAAGSYWLGRSRPSAAPQTSTAAPSREILFYRNPMNPAVTSPVPAKDEMGMDYVPVYADEAAGAAPGTVTIDAGIVQNIGVRTALAERRMMTRQIRTVGRVAYDEQGLSHVHLRSEGWVEKLFVAETGQRVRAGQPLLSLYSPLIVSTEQEYRLAVRGVAALSDGTPPEIAAQARALLASTAERLRLLDVPEAELQRLQRGGDIRREVTLTAPASGIVQFIGAREGQFLGAQADVFRIADLSTVWVLADLYEDEVPWVQVGDRATLRLRGVPGQAPQARVDYVYPYLEGKTRTQKVRLHLANPDGLLKPDMYADVTLDAGRRIDAVAVPEAAIVRSGTRAQLFVQRAPGRFEPRAVTLGAAADGYVQILDGVDAGEPVVVSGQFLIDSESKLREAAAKLMPQAGSAAAEPVMDHGAIADAAPPATAAHSH
ncbi:MAG: efflux RND transporter periplasmic adaptor subunit [Pseudomonadota bacterium]